jgi:hypothetical protein
LGCNSQKNTYNKIKFSPVTDNKISSLIINNFGEIKEIKSKSDIAGLIDLINSVNITKSNVETPTGMGIGVIVKYSNGQEFQACFLSSTMGYNLGSERGTCSMIDKDIVDTIRSYWNKY